MKLRPRDGSIALLRILNMMVKLMFVHTRNNKYPMNVNNSGFTLYTEQLTWSHVHLFEKL